MKTMLFTPGQIVATPPALEALENEGVAGKVYLERHLSGDWGDLDEEDKIANNDALVDGDRILSAYILPKTGEKIWIITEWDRSVTTLLLPDDY